MLMSCLQPDLQYLSIYCSIFQSQISAGFFMTARSWGYAQIQMGRKTTEFSFLRDHGFRFGCLKTTPILGEEQGCFWLRQLWSLTPSTSLKMGGSSGICRSKMGSSFFSIFHAELAWILSSSYHLSQISCKHATINFERGKQLGKRERAMGLSSTNRTINLKQ